MLVEYHKTKAKINRLISNKVWVRRFFYLLMSVFFLREWHVKRLLRQIKFSSTQPVILDAGTGFGQYAYYCIRKFKYSLVTGIDVNQKIVKNNQIFANKIKKPLRFIQADLHDLVLKKKFDLILLIDVLEHIKKDAQVLARLTDHLNHKGYMIIHTPHIRKHGHIDVSDQ